MRRLLLLVLLAGCSAGSGAPPPAKTCTPGERYPCFCQVGPNGTQGCKDDGSGYTACECPGEPPVDAGVYPQCHQQGCWDGQACQDGLSVDACGGNGEACVVCPTDRCLIYTCPHQCNVTMTRCWPDGGLMDGGP